MPEFIIDSDRTGYINGENLANLIKNTIGLTIEQSQLRVRNTTCHLADHPLTCAKLESDRWVYNASRQLTQAEIA